jgi:hypothetical protein
MLNRMPIVALFFFSKRKTPTFGTIVIGFNSNGQFLGISSEIQ